jgi:serine/threonine protein phosphatase PrpC
MKVAAQTDVGWVRDHNEDSLHVDEHLGLLIVADGVGGHKGGAVASAVAVQVIVAAVKATLPTATDAAQISQLIQSGIRSAHEEICARATANPDLNNMGMTVVLAFCQRDTAHIAHVGDSRAYLLHHGKMQQLTEDHSVVAELIKARQLTPRAARHHRLRHLITRSLGAPESASPDLQCLPWAPGDCLLLCSDGLTNMVEERAIRKCIVQGGADVQATCAQLVALAKTNGGTDNITVVLAHNG